MLLRKNIGLNTILWPNKLDHFNERERHSEKTIGERYDPDKMPEGLRMAHHEMDFAVEQCYRLREFTNDDERLEYLFKLYEGMIESENG